MKLTVGSLPTAVYWQRRAVVFGALLTTAILAWVSCSGPARSSDVRRAAGAGRGGAAKSSPSLTPTVEPSPAATPSATAASAPPADPPVAAASARESPPAACSDDDLELVPMADQATVQRGQELPLYLKVKNVSARACRRDLGADAQEMFLQQDALKVWSSDACDPLHGVSVRTLSPGEEQVFNVRWNGRATANGCSDQAAPAAGRYQLVARLAGKLSAPALITVS